MDQGPGEFLATMYVFADQLRGEYERAAQHADLTPSEAIVMGLLSEPLPMSDLADRRHCDPSNITWIVDRLERKGLAVRSPDMSDRRVKRVGLTDEGRDKLTRFRRELDRISCLNELTAEQQQLLLGTVPLHALTSQPTSAPVARASRTKE